MTMDAVLHDIRYAVRQLIQRPGFSLVAIATLGLGIGASTTAFSVADAVLWRALPYRMPGRVVVLWGHDVNGRFNVSERERLRYQTAREIFASVGAYRLDAANLTGLSQPERVNVAALDAEVLPTLGVTPLLGRGFSTDENRAGGPRVALVSYELWQGRLGGRRDILGTTLDVDGAATTVIGILPRAFRLPTDFTGPGSDVYLPLALGANPDPRNIHYLTAVGRLAPGVDGAEAARRLAALSAELRAEIASLPSSFVAQAMPVIDQVAGNVRPALLGLLSAAVMVLLIACVNVANLLLVRAERRRQEMAVRTALGAGQARLARQLLCESAVLAIAAGAVGLLLASWLTQLVVAMHPANLPRLSEIGFDPRRLAVAIGLAAATAVVFGLVPLRHATRKDGHALLRTGARTGVDRVTQRMRRGFVVAQLALAVMLAVGAGLLIRTVQRLQAVDAGFDASGVLTAQLSPPAERYPAPGGARRFYEDVLARVRAIPGVERAGAVSSLPLDGSPGDWGIRIEGREEERLPSGRRPWADLVVVTDDYFAALGATLVDGRALSGDDAASAPPVVLINDALARAYWPGQSALGRRFKLSTDIDPVYRTVVGIVADIRQAGLDAAVRPAMYLPYSQFPAGPFAPPQTMNLVLRAHGDPLGLTGAVRQAVRGVDPEVPVALVRTLGAVRHASTAVRRFDAGVFTALGLLALVLVSVGVYGVIAYTTALRTRELAVRQALGASPRGILALILGEAGRVAVVGVAIGLVGAGLMGRLLGSLLFGVQPRDPATFAAVAVVVGAIALAASFIPAVRATRVDPMVALRTE